MSAKPLHVLVGEALRVRPRISYEIVTEDEAGSAIGFDSKREADDWLAKMHARGRLADHHVAEWKFYPFYDTDWSATGPLIERLQATVYWDDDSDQPAWVAQDHHKRGSGPTPLIAVCHLILALHAAGKLPEAA